MKHLTLALILLTSISSFAADKKYGAGFILGDPTALSFRYDQSAERAWDAQLAFRMSDYILVYGDYLVKFPGVFNSTEKFIEQLTPYAGLGPVIALAAKKDHTRDGYFDKRDDSVALALRIPFGIEWRYDKFPIGIGLEVAPGIVIVPSTDGFLHGGVTFRYYF